MAPKKRFIQAKKKKNEFSLVTILLILCIIFSAYVIYESSKYVINELTGLTVAEADICISKPPVIHLDHCNDKVTEKHSYYCDIYATDPDNNTVFFYDNTDLFEINMGSGGVYFIPTPEDVGTHNFLITAQDDSGCLTSNSTATLTITVNPTSPPYTGYGGGGGGGGGGAEGAIPPEESCTPQWECSPWSSCSIDGRRRRNCWSINWCPYNKPDEEQRCIYVLPPKGAELAGGAKELCNFDSEKECTQSIGVGESWIFQYKGEELVLNLNTVEEKGAGFVIDGERSFYSQKRRTTEVDIDGDGTIDFEYMLHGFENGRAEITVRRSDRVEVVVEKPVYVANLPILTDVIPLFVSKNACKILFLLLFLSSLLVYVFISKMAGTARPAG